MDPQILDDLECIEALDNRQHQSDDNIYKAREWVQRAKVRTHPSPRSGLKQDFERRMILDDETLGSLSSSPITVTTISRVLESKE